MTETTDASRTPDGGTRERMLQGAIELLATRGVHGASVLQVLDHTGTPRGSVYHHFPGGKDQLISEALEAAGDRHDAWIAENADPTPVGIVDRFVEFWERLLVDSAFESGCPILAVTVSSPDGALHAKAADVFATSLGRLSVLLQQAGLTPDAADELGTLMVASAEGATVLARAQRSLRPLETVAESLRARARELTP